MRYGTQESISSCCHRSKPAITTLFSPFAEEADTDERGRDADEHGGRNPPREKAAGKGDEPALGPAEGAHSVEAG